MNGKFTLYMDQYGNHWYAKSAKELRSKIGGGRISTMYRDKLGGPVKIGYIIGKHWCEAFQPLEEETPKMSEKNKFTIEFTKEELSFLSDHFVMEVDWHNSLSDDRSERLEKMRDKFLSYRRNAAE